MGLRTVDKIALGLGGLFAGALVVVLVMIMKGPGDTGAVVVTSEPPERPTVMLSPSPLATDVAVASPSALAVTAPLDVVGRRSSTSMHPVEEAWQHALNGSEWITDVVGPSLGVVSGCVPDATGEQANCMLSKVFLTMGDVPAETAGRAPSLVLTVVGGPPEALASADNGPLTLEVRTCDGDIDACWTQPGPTVSSVTLTNWTTGTLTLPLASKETVTDGRRWVLQVAERDRGVLMVYVDCESVADVCQPPRVHWQ